jgi:hypothetical protein
LSNILLILSDLGIYFLWLWTLALNFASSLILVNNYIKSRGTPIGRSAFYFFLSAFLWGITALVFTIPTLEKNNVGQNYLLLFFPFLASIALSLGTHERTRIQILLTPGTRKQSRDNRLWFILSFCIFVVALIGFIGGTLNNSFLKGMGGLTGLGFILIAGLFIALTQPKFSHKLIYVGSAILLILGFTVISGNLLGIPTLYSPLFAAPTTVPTGLVFIIAGLWIAATELSGLKWWSVKITMAMAILSTVLIQIVSYVLHHPAALSSSALLIVLVGGAILWQSWKTPNS